MAHREIHVHDFAGCEPRDVYDRTQVDDSIKDGDVLNLGNGNVAILVKAWPTIVVGEIEQFHRLKAGTCFESFAKGKYAASAAKARVVSSSCCSPAGSIKTVLGNVAVKPFPESVSPGARMLGLVCFVGSCPFNLTAWEMTSPNSMALDRRNRELVGDLFGLACNCPTPQPRGQAIFMDP